MSVFKRTPEELRPRAGLFWPRDLLARQEAASVIPLLVGTQNKFISILDVSDRTPDSWKKVLAQTKEFHANLFLKHLMVLSDVGGEPLMRLRTELPSLFPTGGMVFEWIGNTYEYAFKEILKGRRLNNKSLFVDGKSLARGRHLDGVMEDVIMLLLFGAMVTNTSLPQVIAEKCMIGSLIGKKEELQRFVRQRYILVSRITAGATSNALGQLAQDFVCETLRASLPKWTITRNGQIPGISQNAGNTDINFDIIAESPKKKFLPSKWVIK